jgi:TolB protein
MNRLFLRLACLAFVMGMVVRCDSNRGPVAPELEAPQSGAIHGIVSIGGSPIGGVQVSLTGPGATRTAMSGTNGGFAFTGLQPGVYTVRATLAGATCTPTTAIMEAGEAITTNIECGGQSHPRGTASISGTVAAGDAPLGGVQVVLTGLALPAALAVERAVTTDPNGRFTFANMTGGNYTVTARASGFACVSPTLEVQPNETARADISCAGDVGGGPAPPPATAPPTGKIAFERAGRILVVDPDGSNIFAFIDGLAPSWSPDGGKLVFQRPGCLDRSLPPYADCDDVWTVNADGSGLSPITSYEWVKDRDPVWSPDGSRVAFVRFVHGIDDTYLVVTNADPPSALWSEAVLSAWWPISRPTWSPDGTRIAFTCQGLPPSGESDICVVSSARNVGYSGGGIDGVDKLMNDTWTDFDPAWSPDGAWIAFTTNRDATDGRSSIALMSPDGSGFTRLVPGRRPAWSPDGSRMVFVGESNAPGLYVVNADGSGLTRITNNPADTAPSWGP